MAQAPHRPSDESRQLAETLARYAVRQEAICAAVGVSLPTLHKYYREELDRGEADAQEQIGRALFDKAVIDKDTTALIFLGKTRLGLKETSRTEHTGANGGPIRTSEESPRELIERRLAGLKVVGGTDTDTEAA